MRTFALVTILGCLSLLSITQVGCVDADYFVLDMLYPPSVCAISHCDDRMKKHLSNNFVAHSLIVISSSQQAEMRCPSPYGKYKGDSWGPTYKKTLNMYWPNLPNFSKRSQTWEDYGTCWLEWAQQYSQDEVSGAYTPPGFQEKYFDRGILLSNIANPMGALSATCSPVQLNAENDVTLIDAALQKKWGISRYHLFCQKYAGSDYLTRVRLCFDTRYNLINCNVMLKQDTRKACGQKITIPLFP
eukprot:TRINITY_DN0_c560_g1_i1.p1 TRINITY_DN0_c560_g1~~TRINITY_DN0_c560_g1_i1.p1  ORF type:complete len:244 (+),score=35.25 TRINITY_DN0_c560_g1_i1:49-780(+)